VRTHRIVTAQRDAGLDPSVAAFPGWPLDAPPGTAGRYELDGIGYHRVHPGRELPGGLAGQIDAGVEAVCALARELRPGVLHAATDHRNGSIAVAAGARLGLPVVYEVRGFLEETWLSAAGEAARGGERHRLIVERESALVRTADAVVMQSETIRTELVARGAEEDRIVLAPNAVDPAVLDDRPDGSAVHCAHVLEAGDFVVGSVSSIVGYEGFTTLVRAVGLLRDRGVPAHLLLVGDGKARPEVEAAVRDLGLSELCVLPGRVDRDEALRAQAALDVLVVPRADERVCRLVTPLKPVEAMALGTPVVASDLPALRELLCGGEAGLMVPPGEPGPLADALQRLREDGELRAGLALRGVRPPPSPQRGGGGPLLPGGRPAPAAGAHRGGRPGRVRGRSRPAERRRAPPLSAGSGGGAGQRTGWPCRASSALTSAMVKSRKWKTEAARTASAPASTAGGKCPPSPVPPLAISGTSTTARAARTSSGSNPALVPSASIELSRISPAPSSAARRTHST